MTFDAQWLYFLTTLLGPFAQILALLLAYSTLILIVIVWPHLFGAFGQVCRKQWIVQVILIAPKFVIDLYKFAIFVVDGLGIDALQSGAINAFLSFVVGPIAMIGIVASGVLNIVNVVILAKRSSKPSVDSNL